MTTVPPNITTRLPGRARIGAVIGRLGPLIGLIFVWALFAILRGELFIRWDNQRLMLLQTSVVGTAAVGATLIIIAGGIDLSVGASIALGTVVIASLLKANLPPVAAIAGGLATAVASGAAIGGLVIGHVGRLAAGVASVLVALWLWRHGPVVACAAALVVGGLVLAVGERFLKRIPLSPFIVTLGMWGALRGAAKGLGHNQPVYPTAGQISRLADLMRNAESGVGSLLAPGAWLLIGLALLAAGLLRYTRFGRHVFAIGSNEQTARLCGINVERTKLLVYMLGVGCAGLAALLQFSYLSMGDPTTADGYELKVIAAAVIGGASLAGGEGSILGTIVGALIMTVVDNGCTKLGLDNWVQEIVTGAIIVVAVALDRWRHRRAL